MLLVGCEQRPPEERNPAPSSSITLTQAQGDAAFWILGRPNRSYSLVAPTGSMLPTLDSRSVLLLETVTATDLRPNDLAIYTRDDGRAIVHRVKAIHPHGILFDGDNNKASDGWIDPTRITHRVAGILYTRR